MDIFTGIGATVGGAILTKRSIDLGLNFNNVVDRPHFMQKLKDCYVSFTNHEYKTLGIGKGSLFGIGKTKDIRNANIAKYMIDHGHANTKGDFTKDSKNILLSDARKARLNAKQTDEFLYHLFYSGNDQAKKINQACTSLINLYTRKNNLLYSSDKFPEDSRLTFQQRELKHESIKGEELGRINVQISAQEIVLKELLSDKKLWDDNTDVMSIGFKSFIEQFTVAKPSYSISDFIQVYAFKLRLLSDSKYAEQVYKDFSAYTFESSVGVLSATHILERKYGAFIANLLNSSSLGDVDSGKNISRYFMETLYFLLNDGSENFNLKKLCVGKLHDTKCSNDNSVGAQDFSSGSDFGSAFTDSYRLNENGITIMNNIGEYYLDLSTKKFANANDSLGDTQNLFLENYGEPQKRMLKWNLIGGINTDNSNFKRGIFYRIDDQLATFKKPTADKHIYKLHEGFQQTAQQQTLIAKLNQNRATISKNKIYEMSISSRELDLREYLAEIAKRVKLHQKDQKSITNKDRTQLNSLKYEYDKLIRGATDKSVTEFFKQMLNDNEKYNDFMKIEIILKDDKSDINDEDTNNSSADDSLFIQEADRISRNSNISSPKIFNLVSEYEGISQYVSTQKELAQEALLVGYSDSINARNEGYNTRKFNLLFDSSESQSSLYLEKYNKAIGGLGNKIKECQIFKDIQSIFSSLDSLQQFITFYNQVRNKETIHSQAINMIADLPTLITLSDNAIKSTKEYVDCLYRSYNETKQKINSADASKLSEKEIIEYSVMNILFENLDNFNDFELRYRNFVDNPLRSESEWEELQSEYNEMPDLQKRLFDSNIFIKKFSDFRDENNFPVSPRSKENSAKSLFKEESLILSECVEKLKGNLGRFAYVESSISAIKQFDKFRIQSELRIQTSLIQDFVKTCNSDYNLTEGQRKCFAVISQSIDFISSDDCTLDNITQIIQRLNGWYQSILGGTDESKKVELPVSKNKNESIKLSEQDVIHVRNLYTRLIAQDAMKIEANKVPASYVGLFQNATGEPNMLTKAYRIFVALLTGVSTNDIKIDPDKRDSQHNIYLGIINKSFSLRTNRLNALATMSYLHMELVNNFSQMANSIKGNIAPLKTSIDLVEKVLQQAVSPDAQGGQIKIANFKQGLSLDEKELLDKILTSYSFNGEDKIHWGRLVQLIKDGLNNKENDIEVKQLEKLTSYIDVAMGMCEEIKALNLECENIDKNYSQLVKNLNEKIKSRSKSEDYFAKSIGPKDRISLDHLANYFNNDGYKVNAEAGIRQYQISSTIIAKMIDLFNLCFRIENKTNVNSDATDNSNLFASRSRLEQIKRNLNQNGIKDFEIWFFDGVTDPNLDEKEQNKIKEEIKANIKNSNVLDIKAINQMIEQLKGEEEKNAYKFYVNKYQYGKLSEKFASFYLEHYFSIEEFQTVFDQTIDYIIRSAKRGELRSAISDHEDRFVDKFSGLQDLYQRYQEKSTELLDQYTKLDAHTIPLYNMISQKHFVTMNEDWKSRNISTHEWIIKTIEIVKILNKINDNDVPSLRMVLNIEALFEYLNIYHFKGDKNTLSLLPDLKLKLQRLFAEDPDNTSLDSIKDVEKQLFEIIDKLSPTYKTLWDKIKLFLVELFSSKTREERVANIKQSIKVLNDVWGEIIQGLTQIFKDYDEDIKLVEEHIALSSSNSNKLKCLSEKAPEFYSALNKYCAGVKSWNIELQSSREEQVVNLIASNWSDFAELSDEDGEKIFSLDFMQKAREKYLSDNYRISGSTNADFLCIMKLKQSLEANNLDQIFEYLLNGDKATNFNKVFDLFVSKHSEEFNKLLETYLNNTKLTRECFTQGVYDFLSSNNGINVQAMKIFSGRCTEHGLEQSYENLFKSYEIETKCKEFEKKENKAVGSYIDFYSKELPVECNKNKVFETYGFDNQLIQLEFANEVSLLDEQSKSDVTDVTTLLAKRAENRDVYSEDAHKQYMGKYVGISFMRPDIEFVDLNLQNKLYQLVKTDISKALSEAKTHFEKEGNNDIEFTIHGEKVDKQYKFTQDKLTITHSYLLCHGNEIKSISETFLYAGEGTQGNTITLQFNEGNSGKAKEICLTKEGSHHTFSTSEFVKLGNDLECKLFISNSDNGYGLAMVLKDIPKILAFGDISAINYSLIDKLEDERIQNLQIMYRTFMNTVADINTEKNGEIEQNNFLQFIRERKNIDNDVEDIEDDKSIGRSKSICIRRIGDKNLKEPLNVKQKQVFRVVPSQIPLGRDKKGNYLVTVEKYGYGDISNYREKTTISKHIKLNNANLNTAHDPLFAVSSYDDVKNLHTLRDKNDEIKHSMLVFCKENKQLYLVSKKGIFLANGDNKVLNLKDIRNVEEITFGTGNVKTAVAKKGALENSNTTTLNLATQMLVLFRACFEEEVSTKYKITDKIKAVFANDYQKLFGYCSKHYEQVSAGKFDYEIEDLDSEFAKKYGIFLKRVGINIDHLHSNTTNVSLEENTNIYPSLSEINRSAEKSLNYPTKSELGISGDESGSNSSEFVLDQTMLY